VSQTLKWRPCYQAANTLSDKLKYALRKRYEQSINGRMGESDIPYLEGLLHAGIEDAQNLIDAIEQYRHIEVFEE
jgi:hypothetical protein